jgi:protein-glutamine gamma-glutamyltransferase
MNELTRLTFALTALAALTVACAESDAASIVAPLTEAVVAVVLALALRWCINRRCSNPEPRTGAPPGSPEPFFVPALFALIILPWAVEPLRTWLTGDGRPTEWLFLLGLRNVALALGALACWPRCLRLAGLASFFVVLFAVSLGEGAALLTSSGVYLLAAGVWLLRLNWQDRGVAAVSRTQPPRRIVAVVLTSVVLVALAGAAFAPARTLAVLHGFMPSSGGDRGRDPAARGGVNDGDDIVAAKHDAQSVGMTESDLFLDSPDPSLYDALSEAYGEPVRRKQTEAAVAIGQKNVRENELRAAQNQKAGREFSTVRGRRPAPRGMADLKSEAMLYVEGRTPLHLRLAAFDQFDGITWQTKLNSPTDGCLEATNDGTWMRVLRISVPFLTGHDRHAIKIARFATNSIPTPPHLTQFRVEQINRLDFFRWTSPDVLGVIRSSLPGGTVVETENEVLDIEVLQPTHFTRNAMELHDKVRSLAESWTDGLTPGWPQIEAIAMRLKQDYVLDRDYQVPDACTDAVADFLWEARRGPDYQFASAAAVLLRSLGYETRIASGFYVRPDRYDWQARNTPVMQDDIHTWAEVRLLGGVWTTIEPTPGYELPSPRMTWTKRLAATWSGVVDWGRRHGVFLAVASVFLVLAVYYRCELADSISLLVWRVSGRRTWNDRVLATLRLLERRLSRARVPRPASQTPRRWYGQLAGAVAPELVDDVQRILLLADCATYAPRIKRQNSPWPEEEVGSACARLAKGWSLARVRAAGRAGRTPSPIAIGSLGNFYTMANHRFTTEQ